MQQDISVKPEEVRKIPVKDADALTAAFSEYSIEVKKQTEKPSIIKKLRGLKIPQLGKFLSTKLVPKKDEKYEVFNVDASGPEPAVS